VAKEFHYELIQDKKGMYWDLLLYIPTVVILALLSAQLWYSSNQNFAYLLVFLTTFIALIGFNRIAKTRMMILPQAPIAFAVSKKGVSLTLRNETVVELAKDVRFFSDFAGKSFGLTGIDMFGKKQQFVFNRGQFAAEGEFNDAKAALRAFK